MKQLIVPVLAASLCVSFAANPSCALDTITLSGDETPVTGDITDTSKTDITIKAGLQKVERKVSANLVARVRFDQEPPRLNLGRNDEAAGRFAAALEKYQESLEENPSELLKTDLEFLIARTTARMALADATKLDEARTKLDDFLKSNPESFRYYPALSFLGEVYLAADDFTNAQATFSRLEQAPWTDYKMAAKTALARLLLKQNKVAEARAAFDAVVGMSAATPAEKVRRFDALLGKAICLQRENDHEGAISELVEVTNQAPGGETRLQAEAYVRQGDSYRLLGQTKSAILAYLHVDVLFPKESALHAEALYWLSELWTAAGHPDRSAEASTKLESTYPNSAWAKKLAAAGSAG